MKRMCLNFCKKKIDGKRRIKWILFNVSGLFFDLVGTHISIRFAKKRHCVGDVCCDHVGLIAPDWIQID